MSIVTILAFVLLAASIGTSVFTLKWVRKQEKALDQLEAAIEADLIRRCHK